MYKLIICLILSISSFSYTGKGAFTFSNKEPLNFSQSEFRRYALPQLRTIYQEYFNLYSELSPVFIKLVRTKNLIDQSLRQTNKLESCLKSADISCLKSAKLLKNNLRKIDVSLHEHAGKVQLLRKQLLLRRLNEIQLAIFNLLVQLETYNEDQSSFHFKKFESAINHLSIQYDSFLLGHLDESKNEAFTRVYFSFIKPLKKFVLNKNSSIYLTKNIESLNFAWNEFHMRVTKTNINVTRNTKKQATQIHRRWVSVLKLMIN